MGFRYGLASGLLITALFIVNATSNASEEVPRPQQDSRLKIITLEGSPYERGFNYGKTLKIEINELVEKWRTRLETDYNLQADEFIRRFFENTNYLPAIKKWTPDLLEEVQGIAVGAGIDFNTMLMFQLPDEQWINGKYVAANRCSALGANRIADQPAMIAQNLDIPGFYNGHQTLLHIKHSDSDIESLVFTFSGLIAANGMNNKAVAVTVNTLSQLQHSTDGLPVAFMVRGLLEKHSQKAAVEFLHQAKHASGQNYIIGGKEEVYDFECSANKVIKYIPYEEAQIVYHTNHPLVNDDYTDAYRQWAATQTPDALAKGSSAARFHSLERRLNNDIDTLDAATFEATLKSKDSNRYPVCRTYRSERSGFTFGSTIMILTEEPELRVAANSPDIAEYFTYSFSRGEFGIRR